MAIECSATFDGPDSSLPRCQDMHLPVCTPKQYTAELRVIGTANPQYSGGPLGMEAHLAADYGCAVGAATIPPVSMPQTVMALGYGILMPLALIIFGIVFMLYMGGWDNARSGLQP